MVRFLIKRLIYPSGSIFQLLGVSCTELAEAGQLRHFLFTQYNNIVVSMYRQINNTITFESDDSIKFLTGGSYLFMRYNRFIVNEIYLSR